MNRSTMRTLLRRRLNESTADNWQDADLNELLNAGLHLVQKEVLKVDPLAFIHWSKDDIVSGQSYYPKPQGFWHEIEIAQLDADHPQGYKPMKKQDYNVARELAAGSTEVYCHVGRYFAIFPAPSTSVVDGLQIQWTPTLSMAVDTDVPDLHFALHMAVVLMAQKYALGETGDDQRRVKEELVELLSDIPGYYLGSATENDRLWIDSTYLPARGDDE